MVVGLYIQVFMTDMKTMRHSRIDYSITIQYWTENVYGVKILGKPELSGASQQKTFSDLRSVYTIQYNIIYIQHKTKISLQQQFVKKFGMIGKGVDSRIILSWSTPLPNID